MRGMLSFAALPLKKGKEMLIYTTGPIGYEAAEKLYNENIVRIKKQFPQFFINAFLEIKENMADLDIEKYPADVYIREMREGGLFAALWELCEEAGCGCEIALEKISIRQEVVEILELFKENPYEAASSGCLLIFSPEPVYGAQLIGFTNETKDRIIDIGSHKRYLTPVKRQIKDIENRKGER